MTDFEFYCDEYGGADITDEEEFDRLAKKARTFISHVAYSEVDFEDIDVRSCLCAVCDVYHLAPKGKGVTREKIDDYEVEYEEGSEDNILMHTVRLYLPPVLLYRGF